MEWMKTYHEDHKSVLIMLAKLEGNLMDLKHGYSGPNTTLEFKEFSDILDKVIIPHFKNEEKTIYPEVAAVDEETKAFVNIMFDEHRKLYEAFDKYQVAVKNGDDLKTIETGFLIIDLLRQHILKEEDDLPAIMKQKNMDSL